MLFRSVNHHATAHKVLQQKLPCKSDVFLKGKFILQGNVKAVCILVQEGDNIVEASVSDLIEEGITLNPVCLVYSSIDEDNWENEHEATTYNSHTR